MSVYKISNVLVPVDLSESSLNALDTAVSIAKKHKAALQVLYIDENSLQTIEDVGTPYFSNSVNPVDVINALVGAIQHTHGIKPAVFMEEGNVAETIIKTAFLQHTDLIVMGSHGASGYRDGFIGNNTYAVIKHSSCPVLSVPQKRKLSGFKKILFPIRPVTGALMPYEVVSPFTNPSTLMEVMGINYRMIIDIADSVLETIVSEIKEQLKKDGVIARPLWSDGHSIADEIVNYANKTNPDLVVVTSALDVTSKPRYIGPHAQKIIHCSKAAVLSIKKLSVPSLV
ncbi:MAG TPA: universal stress protein [Flavisolibacter sp.]|nr:universal stress protein [Flavisolibacter sp.]